MSDLTIFGKTYTDVKGIKATDTDGNEVVYGGGYSFEEILANKYADEDTIDINNVSVKAYLFQNGKMKHVIGSGVTFANGGHQFDTCQSLESVSLENSMLGSGGNQFLNCSKLTDVWMPKTFVGQNTFANCTSLVRVAMPMSNYSDGGVSMNNGGFSGCKNLEKADLHYCSKMTSSEFYNCVKLTTLVLRIDSKITAMGNVNVLALTPFKSGGSGGEIYIPKVLYDHLGDGSSLDYKSASNWATYDGYGTITWKQIEGSEYEHYYVDGREVITA